MLTLKRNRGRSIGTPLLVTLATLGLSSSSTLGADAPDKVSYAKQIRPIFQAKCQGCHQPAKAGGGYVMTAFDRLLSGGESKEAAVKPGKPAESFLIEQITPDKGAAAMPKDKPPLTPAEIELISKWISQGAIDDAPATAKARYDLTRPPVYTRPPVLTSIDFSPDGKLLAVAGFHEVLLWKGDGSELLARLVGLSERVESVKFSPDGKKLAVTGGLPARMGEVQVWDVEKRKLDLSVPVTFDTVYGASWSPDGSKIAFGCADNTVRAIEAKSGKEVLFMGSHNDWALGTVFSKDGSHLISVGRDRATKLTEVATQRFVDNITSITPGALKGGVNSITRHPDRDEIIFGGSDGMAKIYRVFRLAVRVIGDDSNIIREFLPMKGRVNAVAVSKDGKRIAAGSSLDGAGEVHIYSYEFDTGLPDDVKAIMSKTVDARNPAEKKKLDDYIHKDVKLIAKTDVPQGGVYGLAYSPDGRTLAAAGGDGMVRLIDATSGSAFFSFCPAPLGQDVKVARESFADAAARQVETVETETLPSGSKVVSLDVVPKSIKLQGRYDYVQLLVTAKLNTGDAVDVTRMAVIQGANNVAGASRSGVVRPDGDGSGELTVAIDGVSTKIPVAVAGMNAERKADFIRDVAPVLSKLGCNAGTCHGSAQGKNGFKFSLRGYDPIYDVRSLTDEHGSRRVAVASPDDSLMLLKPTNSVPHVGGQVCRQGEPYYEIIREWIAQGGKLDLKSPKVVKIELSPLNPIVQRIGSKQQIRVVATYGDGFVRDVTREAFVETGNGEVATADKAGLMTAVRRGEAPILARFEGAYAATTMTVMGDRDGFVWKQPPSFNKIDEFAAGKWKRMKIEPSGLCTDAEFIRRAYLDLTGLPPSAEDVKAFLADTRDGRAKRDALIDKLVGSDAYVEYWSNKWADLLQVNRKFLAAEGAVEFRKWIKNEVATNTAYDKFVKKIVTASGSNKENPAASYYKILREPAAAMENTTHLFLGVRFNCNKCHDHPFERWTQDQYYQTAAYLARFGLKKDPAGGDRQIGGSAVETGKPLYEVVFDANEGEIKHERTGDDAAPVFPFPTKYEAPKNATRREELAAWITSADNPYFAKSYVNRLWGYLFGIGIMEPIDDLRAGNPPTNPELLDYLTAEFVKSGFDARHVIKLITKSRTYQLSFETNKWNSDDKINYSHAIARRLPAEVLYDSVHRVTGSVSRIPGLPDGTRAAAIPDSGIDLSSGFFATFGRPVRESACECERSSGLQLGPVMALVSGPTVSDAISDPKNDIAKIVASEKDDAKVVNEIFLRILNRPAEKPEIEAGLDAVRVIDADHTKLVAALKDREAVVAKLLPKLEKDRQDEIDRLKTEIASFEKEIAPKVAEQQKKRDEQTAKLDADLKSYEATFASKAADWEKSHKSDVEWIPLTSLKLESSSDSKLTEEKDGLIVAAAPKKAGGYTVSAETDLTGITAVRLEVFPHDSLPRKGPGFAPDGNFVLTEIDLTAAPKGKPKEAKKVDLQNALADFSQENYDVKSAIDGVRNQGNGWAVSPSFGVLHWATFETKGDVGEKGGTLLTFKMEHRFGGKDYMIARFRISVAKTKRPAGLGLPRDFQQLFATAPAARSQAQTDSLVAYLKGTDADLRKRQAALAESKKPLPVDPKLLELRSRLAEAGKPLPADAKLVQLRRDVEVSAKQIANKRLTAAQDVAWALINSPSFLFNH